MASTDALSNTTTPHISYKRFGVEFGVFRAAHQFKVAWRIIQSIFILVVNHLRGFKFSTQELFHHNAMLWLVVAMTGIDIPITILYILKLEDPLANWFTVALEQRIMVLAKSLSKRGERALVDAANWISMSIRLFSSKGISIFVPALVVSSAPAPPNAEVFAVWDGTNCFRFRHGLCITRGGLYG